MSKTKMIIAAIVVIAIIVGGYAAMRSKSASVDNTEHQVGGNSAQHEPLNPEAQQTNGKKIAFSEFIKQSGSYKCTVNQNVGGTETQGTTYINSGMIRGEYTTQAQGMSINTTVVVRDGYSYTWNSMMAGMGFKSKVSAAATGDQTAPAAGTYSFNADQIGDYNCQPWTLDNSKFAVPTNVTFREV